MRVVAKKALRDFWERHADVEQQLKTWYKEASKATWEGPADIKQDYAKASILKGGRAVFDICGSKDRLVVDINYERQSVFVGFIGTHTDHDKIDANAI